MKRIMIIGQPGGGKSTLARALGERTGLPVFHIDLIHWKPGWVERDRDEKTRLCHEIHIKDRWIFEGGHSATWAERLDRCDTVVWIDAPLWRRAWRVLWRTAKGYGQTRPDLPENCPEKFSLEFCHFIWRTRHSARQNIMAFIANAPPDKAIHKLTTQSEIEQFLAECERMFRQSH